MTNTETIRDTGLYKGQKVTMTDKTQPGVWEVVGITSQGKVRFINRETQARELIHSAYVKKWVQPVMP